MNNAKPNEFWIGIVGQVGCNHPLTGEPLPPLFECGEASRKKEDILKFLNGFGGADILLFKATLTNTNGKFTIHAEETND